MVADPTMFTPRSKERGPVEARGLERLSCRERRPLRARKSAAPLKRDSCSGNVSGLVCTPRSKERGPVEATRLHADFRIVALTPRSKERGPVEAPETFICTQTSIVHSALERARPR